MSLSGRYFLPGPVEVDTDVTQAMLHPSISHRGQVAEAMLREIQPPLQSLCGTARPVMMISGSATAMMEAGIRAAVRERVLCLVSGVFGERFATIAEQCGKEVIRWHIPRGAVLEPALVEAMHQGPAFDAVTLVHSETSTGALAPLEPLLERFAQMADVVTVVDAVSSVGGMPIEVDRWKVDFLFTGSQKALGLPPGLAFAVASDRLLERARSIGPQGLYLDVATLHEAAIAGRFPTTPALPIVFALQAQLRRIVAEGVDARFARHRAMRERVEGWVEGHGGCEIWAPPGRRSDTVTALRLRPRRSARAIVAELAAHGWTVATGMQEEADAILRIGHMGDLQLPHLEGLLGQLEPLL